MYTMVAGQQCSSGQVPHASLGRQERSANHWPLQNTPAPLSIDSATHFSVNPVRFREAGLQLQDGMNLLNSVRRHIFLLAKSQETLVSTRHWQHEEEYVGLEQSIDLGLDSIGCYLS